MLPSLPDKMEIVFRQGWSWPALIVALVAALCVANYWNRPAIAAIGKRRGRILSALKAFAILLLVLWLLNPRLRYQQSGSHESSVAFVLDSSQSMSTADALGKARYEAARQVLLEGPNSLQGTLARQFQTRTYTFNTGLQLADAKKIAGGVDPAGIQTNFTDTLHALASEARLNRIKAVVLASDGNNTSEGDLRRRAEEVGAPIYTVGVGRRETPDNPWRDLGIDRIDAPTQVNIGQDIEAKVYLKQEGFDNTPIKITAQEGATTLASSDYTLTPAPDQMTPLKFSFKTKGVHTITLSVPHLPGDRIEQNDQVKLTVSVIDKELKVLYLEGTLRWNYKFLKRVLESEDTIKADCIIRTGGAQFYQQGENGGIKFSKGLPANYDDFSQFNVIILGDFPRAMLDDNELAMLDRWVSEGKGGLLVIGGLNTLASGAYMGSKLEAMLPATFRKQGAPQNGSIKIDLTAEGMAKAALSNLASEIPRMPLPHVFAINQIKPGAETWIETRGDKQPVLMAERYGQGRTMLLAADGFWQLNLHEGGAAEEASSAKFWLQLVQYLAQVEDKGQDEKQPLLSAGLDRSYYEPGQPLQIKAKLRKKNAGNAAPALAGDVLIDGKSVAALQFPQPDAYGKTELAWTPPHDGNYTLRLQARAGADHEELALDAQVGRPYRELERNALDETTLRNLARDSGGAYFDLTNAGDIVRLVDASSQATTERVEKDLLDSPVFFILFCLLVSAEWLIRRRRNLI